MISLPSLITWSHSRQRHLNTERSESLICDTLKTYMFYL
jgi:hypothetical protein